MIKLWKSSEQKGTLLVEAIAMLALIAMVTPTLYKKSAERLQEIQDINIATQMRTMGSVVESFIKSHSGAIMTYVTENMSSGGNTLELCYEDSSAGCYNEGYSTLVPFGFNPNDVKNFMPPKVYVFGKDGILQYYIVYGKENDIGKKRATRLASLVGANGGVVQVQGSANVSVSGTGNAWSLDNDMIDEIQIDPDILTDASLMVTAKEPIVIDQDDSDLYLYRVPPANNQADYYKNTMVTDLYMGGEMGTGEYQDAAKDFYSIFNVRKLTLNTICQNSKLIDGDYPDEDEDCVPRDVADLYVGKPIHPFTKTPGEVVVAGAQYRYYNPNEGAAWIYGNLSALNDNFKVFRGGLAGLSADEKASAIVGRTTGYDVMQFARLQNDTDNKAYVDYDDSSVALSIFRASNEDGSARVSMMDGLVNVVEQFNNSDIYTEPVDHALAVGNSSSAGGEGSLITAFHYNDENMVLLNSGSDSSTTWINKHGGDVYINKIEDGSSNVYANTYINDGGGTLLAGVDGEWLEARGRNSSAQVHLLNSGSSNAGERTFTVGNVDPNNVANMVFGDSSRVSLRGDRFRVYSKEVTTMSSNAGGLAFAEELGPNINPSSTDSLYDGATIVGTQTFDVLGSTYLGSKGMSSAIDDGVDYTRGKWELGVAGSAWVDDTLWARKAWLKKAGMAELHAGFSSFDEFTQKPNTGWLNVYNNDARGVIIRNRPVITDEAGYGDSSDVLFQAYSSGVQIWGNGTDAGSTKTFASWDVDTAMIGAVSRDGGPANLFAADINAAYVQGSSLVNLYTADSSTAGVVNVQNNAMQFRGEAGAGSAYKNEILAQAKWFGVTANSSFVDEDNVQFRVGSSDAMPGVSEVRVRNADFAVRDSSGVGKLWVRPDEGDNSTFAQVNIDGSLHVTGNEIVHIASNMLNTAEKDSQRAMFEIDPEYVQIWGKTAGGSSFAGSSATDYYAMLRVNPYDTDGGASLIDDTQDASIYVRKGAIELMQSEAIGSSGVAASEGFGYIKANRFVSNSGQVVPNAMILNDSVRQYTVSNSYDEFMVNPAYTSVMHDIKLTSRGGGRLSDILPDYVLKGVYNVSNDFVEGTVNSNGQGRRIQWSSGSAAQCDKTGGCENANVRWADAYVGKLPFAKCPPGYDILATLMPTSFMMGQAGEVLKATDSGWGSTSGKYYVNYKPRNTQILDKAVNETDGRVAYPGMYDLSSFVFNATSFDADNPPTFSADDVATMTKSKLEGWFMGVPFEETTGGNSSTIEGTNDLANIGDWKYTDINNSSFIVAQPLYFQQNTWLKTSVEPNNNGFWKAYMGFIYDKTDLTGLGSGQGSEGLTSNNANTTDSSIAFRGYGESGNYVWNLFPVPTNSIEGHATVYCYFNRQHGGFEEYYRNGLIERIDQLEHYKPVHEYNTNKDENYVDRLNDPTLKYNDPW